MMLAIRIKSEILLSNEFNFEGCLGFFVFQDMEMEVNAYRAEPDPVGYSSADNQDEEDEQVSVCFSFLIFGLEIFSMKYSEFEYLFRKKSKMKRKRRKINLTVISEIQTNGVLIQMLLRTVIQILILKGNKWRICVNSS